MQAHVKTPRIKIEVKGKNIPSKLISFLKNEYGDKLKIFSDDFVDPFETEWYKKIKRNITPGKTMKHYREMHKLTQVQLGKMLGGLPRQNISNMENGSRPISINIAKKLSKIFEISVERFI
jgi:DNA-binding XRE family transcriptional regulator